MNNLVTHPLYTFGYNGRQPEELLVLVGQLGAVVAGIRFSLCSRVPAWSGGRLARLLGDRYLHLPALGNRNYKERSIELVDVERGTAQVGELLAVQPVILLCVCADVERCHRRLVAEAVAARYGVPVIHL